MKIYRHGDVLIAVVDQVPAAARRCATLVLARGEATGHSHRVQPLGRAELLELGEDRFLRVVDDVAEVVHEEHRTITLPPGTYRVWRQRQYEVERDRLIED